MCQSFRVSSQILTLSSCDPPIWWNSLHIFHLQNKNHSQKWQIFNENHSCETVTPLDVISDLDSHLQAEMQHRDRPGMNRTLTSGRCVSLSAGQAQGQPVLREAGNRSCRQHAVGMGITLHLAPPSPGVQLLNIPVFYTPKFQAVSPLKKSN